MAQIIERADNRASRVFGVGFGMATTMLMPIVLSVLASIKPPSEAQQSPPSYLPSTLSFDNYVKVFEYQAGLLTYVSNSLLVAGITIVLCLALSIPAGYGLARALDALTRCTRSRVCLKPLTAGIVTKPEAAVAVPY